MGQQKQVVQYQLSWKNVSCSTSCMAFQILRLIFFITLKCIPSSIVLCFVANHNCDATCGKSFNGMQVEIMDPDFVSGDGEIVIHSRNVFMGYAKVQEEIQ